MDIPEFPIWISAEEDFLVTYLYRVTRSWQPSGTEAVLKILRRLAQILPVEQRRRPPRCLVDIIRKLMDLRREFHGFLSFIGTPGIHYDRQRNTIDVSPEYWAHIDDEEEEGSRARLYRKYGLTHFEERRYLFGGGCFDCVDYNWLLASAAGVDPEWLGAPQE